MITLRKKSKSTLNALHYNRNKSEAADTYNNGKSYTEHDIMKLMPYSKILGNTPETTIYQSDDPDNPYVLNNESLDGLYIEPKTHDLQNVIRDKFQSGDREWFSFAGLKVRIHNTHLQIRNEGDKYNRMTLLTDWFAEREEFGVSGALEPDFVFKQGDEFHIYELKSTEFNLMTGEVTNQLVKYILSFAYATGRLPTTINLVFVGRSKKRRLIYRELKKICTKLHQLIPQQTIRTACVSFKEAEELFDHNVTWNTYH